MNPRQTKMCAYLAFAGCLLAAGTVLGQTPAATDTVITHAKIFTLAGNPIEDGTVVIHDGKIAAVGASVSIPPGAKVIDAAGLQVYPGLFDPITQMGLREIGAVPATVDTTETGMFNPDLVAATAILPSSAHIPVTRAAGITEVLAVPSSGGIDSSLGSNIIGGQASAIHLAGWTATEMSIRRNAAMVVVWPAIETESFDFATFSRKEKPFADAKKEYDKAVNQLADYLEESRHYAQVAETKGALYDRDVKLEAMIPVVHGEMPVLVFCRRARDIPTMICEKQKLKMILAESGGRSVED